VDLLQCWSAPDPHLDQVVPVQQLAPERHNNATPHLALNPQQLQHSRELAAGQARHLHTKTVHRCCRTNTKAVNQTRPVSRVQSRCCSTNESKQPLTDTVSLVGLRGFVAAAHVNCALRCQFALYINQSHAPERPSGAHTAAAGCHVAVRPL